MTNLETVLTDGFHIRNITRFEYFEAWTLCRLSIDDTHSYSPKSGFYYKYGSSSLEFPTYLDFKNYVKGGNSMKKIEVHGTFEVSEDFTGGMVDIGDNFKEAIPLDVIVWYWDIDAEDANLGIYKGVDELGYAVQTRANGSTVHYDHVKLYKKGEGDVE